MQLTAPFLTSECTTSSEAIGNKQALQLLSPHYCLIKTNRRSLRDKNPNTRSMENQQKAESFPLFGWAAYGSRTSPLWYSNIRGPQCISKNSFYLHFQRQRKKKTIKHRLMDLSTQNLMHRTTFATQSSILKVIKILIGSLDLYVDSDNLI